LPRCHGPSHHRNHTGPPAREARLHRRAPVHVPSEPTHHRRAAAPVDVAHIATAIHTAVAASDPPMTALKHCRRRSVPRQRRSAAPPPPHTARLTTQAPAHT